MHLNFLSTLVALVSLATAAIATSNIAGASIDMTDANSTHAALERRDQVAGIYLCSNKHFASPCQWFMASGGKCHNYMGLPGSVGPDHGLTCTLWSDWNCQGNWAPDMVYPGWSYFDGSPMYLSAFWRGADHFRSFKCHWL